MCSKYTPDQIAEFKEAFSLFDKNGDGVITTKELNILLKSLGEDTHGIDMENLIEQFQEYTEGRNITFMGFLTIIEKKREDRIQIENDELVNAFRMFDKNGNGYITALELKVTLASLGEQLTDEEIEEMIKAADLDKDGRIDFDEFARMLTNGN